MGLLTLSSQRPMSQKGYNYPIPDNPLILPPRQKSTIASKTETEEVGIKYPVLPEQLTLEQKIEESDVQKSDDYMEPESSLLYTSVASEAKEDAEVNTQALPPYVRNSAATTPTTLKETDIINQLPICSDVGESGNMQQEAGVNCMPRLDEQLNDIITSTAINDQPLDPFEDVAIAKKDNQEKSLEFVDEMPSCSNQKDITIDLRNTQIPGITCRITIVVNKASESVGEDLNPKENLISNDDDEVDEIFEIDYSELTDFDPKNFDLVEEYFDEEARSNFDPEPLTTPVPSSTTNTGRLPEDKNEKGLRQKSVPLLEPFITKSCIESDENGNSINVDCRTPGGSISAKNDVKAKNENGLSNAEYSLVKNCQELSQQGLEALPGINCRKEPKIDPVLMMKMPIVNERPILGLDFNLAAPLFGVTV